MEQSSPAQAGRASCLQTSAPCTERDRDCDRFGRAAWKSRDIIAIKKNKHTKSVPGRKRSHDPGKYSIYFANAAERLNGGADTQPAPLCEAGAVGTAQQLPKSAS